MADRSTGQMDKYDYYVLGNGMKGVFLWDGYTGKLVKNLIPEPGISVAFPNNELRKCMTGDNNGCFYRWDIAKLALLFKHAGHAPTQQVTSIDYTTDTYRFVTASTDRTIKLWEPSTQAAGTLAPQTTIKTPAYTMQAKLLPNGKTIVSAGYDGTVHLWDAQTSVKKKSIDVSNAPLWTLDVSLDGRFALAGGDDQLVSLIDLSTGQLVKQFEGHEAKVEFVSFTANKEFVCSCASDKTLRFWNITSGREEQRATHDSEVFGISPAYYRMNGDVHLTATTETVYAWESISKE